MLWKTYQARFRRPISCSCPHCTCNFSTRATCFCTECERSVWKVRVFVVVHVGRIVENTWFYMWADVICIGCDIVIVCSDMRRVYASHNFDSFFLLILAVPSALYRHLSSFLERTLWRTHFADESIARLSPGLITASLQLHLLLSPQSQVYLFVWMHRCEKMFVFVATNQPRTNNFF